MQRLWVAVRVVVCWALAIALVVPAFAIPMVWVTRWMFDLITGDAHGFKDSTLALLGAFVAGPIVGIAAGAACAAVAAVPGYYLIRLSGRYRPVRRRDRPVLGANPPPAPYTALPYQMPPQAPPRPSPAPPP